ncbi:MAG: xanthine dehydrogenase family protein subunit M [Acidimicrobiia bacterium]|nr:xanthine dehydrogenase family protein subunit M [Acidimicrobiia bacterium]MYG57901.1 xanthine dehydrogenase family protein subunit M [Acidimicrobiia bacterium]MYJ33672.1 xanthine dehydrogenase family protein subunit M [Acidimicrobiia bacterium]
MSDVVVARGLDEALSALSDHPDATVLAGGTDLMVEINRGLRRPSQVVAVAQVPELRQWSVADNRVIVGGGVTYTEMMTTALADAAPALAQAARTVGSPPIRNAGTLGGNLGTASPAGDTLPVLAALNAEIVLAGPDGERRMGLDDFVVGVKRTSLQPGELIVRAEMDRPRGRQEFLKIGPRNAMVISMAGLALVVDRDARAVRCALGAVAAGIPRATEAEAWVAERIHWDNGSGVDEAVADEFGQRVAAASSPIDDHRSTAVYRRHAVAVLATRALKRAFAEEGSGDA